MTTLRFDDATHLARAFATEFARTHLRAFLVRDVIGRFTLVVDDRGADLSVDDELLATTRREFESKLGSYVSAIAVTRASSMFDDSALDRAAPSGGVDVGVRFLDNTVVGGDWSRVEAKSGEPRSSARVAVYGFKGGVGRSTATAVLARYLADRGHVVLVVDLDLESPGVDQLIAENVERPRYGIVDHMVELAIGDASGLDLVADTGYAPPSGSGSLWIAPARGFGQNYRYLPKLNRIYGDLPGLPFSRRLESAVAAAEGALAARLGAQPTVVLLDSRAGVHDIAAAVISRIADHTFLFAGDTPQTWEGYRDLFQQWNEAGEAVEIRERLRVIAAMVPQRRDLTREEYLRKFRESAWDVFSILYDDEDPEFYTEAFAPAPDADGAPHSPIPILFNAEMVNLDPSSPRWWAEPYAVAAYIEFITEASSIISSLVRSPID